MDMSTIYLPNGGRIVIHSSWKSTTDTSGNTVIRTHSDEYLGTIQTSGIVHLSKECNHSYFPPATTLDSAFEVIKRDMQKLSFWQLKTLKTLVANYNTKSNIWKK